MNKIINMTRLHYKFLVDDLRQIQRTLSDGASIDIRLCVDFEDGEPVYVMRSGLADYDQYHSEFCAAGSIDSETKFNGDADPTLEELINQVMDQCSDRGEDK